MVACLVVTFKTRCLMFERGPLPHSSQELLPMLRVAFPLAQDVQVSLPRPENFPAGHG